MITNSGRRGSDALQSLLVPLQEENNSTTEECDELVSFLEDFNEGDLEKYHHHELLLFPKLPSCATRSGLLSLYKILVVGDRGVGKTTFVDFYGNFFRELVVQKISGGRRMPTSGGTSPTTQLEFLTREVTLAPNYVAHSEDSLPSTVSVQFWDTPGGIASLQLGENFEADLDDDQEGSLRESTVERTEADHSNRALFKNVCGIFFVYSVDNRESLMHIPRYYSSLLQSINSVNGSSCYFDDVVCYVVGNKMDRCPSNTEEGENIAHVLNMKHVVVSSVFSKPALAYNRSLLLAFTQMLLTVNAIRTMKDAEKLRRDSHAKTTRPRPTSDRKRFSQVDVSGIGNHQLSASANTGDNCSSM
ncbi:Ras family, putative [Angomonas deanei]|uniref:Ras family, putative n=1 Tax=Angomonas deanei TaxID=59799 RepID=A0A7G2C3H0_9TRYP|nr:Ras family, putative [Angomonas deanei]